MAVKLIANYAKRLGLPGYSSHQFSVSVETELHDVSNVAGESARLYASLQKAVDDQIQQTGFVPPEGYGMNGNGAHTNGKPENDAWACSDKQRDLIQTIVAENGLEKNEVEKLAQERFGAGVKALNKLQASGLIDELLEKHGKPRNGNRRYRRPVGGERR